MRTIRRSAWRGEGARGQESSACCWQRRTWQWAARSTLDRLATVATCNSPHASPPPPRLLGNIFACLGSIEALLNGFSIAFAFVFVIVCRRRKKYPALGFSIGYTDTELQIQIPMYVCLSMCVCVCVRIYGTKRHMTSKRYDTHGNRLNDAIENVFKDRQGRQTQPVSCRYIETLGSAT